MTYIGKGDSLVNSKSTLKVWLLILFFPYIAVVYIVMKKPFKNKSLNNAAMVWCILISIGLILDIATPDAIESNGDLVNQTQTDQHNQVIDELKEAEIAKAEEETKKQEEIAKAEEETKKQEEIAKAEDETKKQEEIAKAEDANVFAGFKPAVGNIYPNVKLYAKEDEMMVHYFTVLEIGKDVVASTGYIMEDAIKVRDEFTGEVYWKDRKKMLFLQYQLTGEYMYFVSEDDPNLK